jgi:hypothetical protein
MIIFRGMITFEDDHFYEDHQRINVRKMIKFGGNILSIAQDFCAFLNGEPTFFQNDRAMNESVTSRAK